MRYSLKTIFSIMVISALMFTGQKNALAQQAFELPSPIHINIPIAQQDNPSWCWVAVVDMILRSRASRSIQQCELYENWMGISGSVCCGNIASCDRPAHNIQEIQNMLRLNGIESTYYQGIISFPHIYNYLWEGRPIVMVLAGNTTNHVVVMTGMYFQPHPTKAGQAEVIITYNDPADGTVTRAHHTDLLSTWRESLIINAPNR